MESSNMRDLPGGAKEIDVEVHGVQDTDRIITLEDLLRKFGVDLDTFDLTAFRPNSWETHFKVETGDGEDAIYRAVNYQAKAVLTPSKGKLTAKAAVDIFNELVQKSKSPKARKVKRPQKDGEATALVVDLFDLHIGMLAWAEETGEASYDSNLGVELAMTAIEGLISRLSGLNITKIIFPMGNDLLHTDTTIQGKGGATTAGTPQDVDTRYLKMYRLAMNLMINIIDRLREIAPVEVIIVPGNHDRERVAYMGESIHAWYRNDPEVTVNNDANLRKYSRFGNTLLGFTHGKDEKPETLPLLMAQERKQDWAATEYRIFHTGHIHRKRKMVSVSTDTYQGVEVISIPSLVPPDSWHSMKGFVGGGRAAEAYIVGEDSGPNGHFRFNVPRLAESV